MSLRVSLVVLLTAVLLASTRSTDPDAGGQHWALLVAGSMGYFNYRHQADVCHAYQILHAHGIPDERIVVMMYDDIANNEENPTKGTIINHINGSDVYHDVPKDYTGKDVTPDNFLNILQGKKDAMQSIGSGKVIQSGPKDNVFVYFADHGAPGLIAFPTTELHAQPMMSAIKAMYANKQYKEMVWYVEACESGSMFHNLLPRDINVYVTTAANPKESSYACYYDKLRKTYLGDLYSVKWMEDSDQENLSVETLHHQFEVTKHETNLSHVQQYGDLMMSKETVARFQGNQKAKTVSLPKAPLDAVRSEDVPMATLHHRLAGATTDYERAIIMDEMRRLGAVQQKIKDTMKAIVALAAPEQADTLVNQRQDLYRFDCYERAVRHFDEHCFDLSTYEYALRQLYALVNLCEMDTPMATIEKSIETICVHN